jgi:hypothetical protein
MVRRALLGFLPGFLALAFLCGTPATTIGGPETSATSWNTAAATTPVARGSLTQDVADVAVNQSADEDDTPDARVVRVVSAVIWPDSALAARILHVNDRAGPSHRPCASPPRAPPTA